MNGRAASAAGRLACAVLALAAAARPVPAAERIDHDLIARLKMEGFQRSRVLETAAQLSDVHGPRVTGSPELDDAVTWTLRYLRSLGLDRVEAEPYETRVPGYSLQRHSLEMLSPRYLRATAVPKFWSPATPGAVRATPTVVDVRTEADFERYRGRLKGAVVMNGRPEPQREPPGLPRGRWSEEDLRRMEGATKPADPSFGPFHPESYWAERAPRESQRVAAAIEEFFASEKIAALLEPSSREDLVVDAEDFARLEPRPSFPAFVVAREHYGRILRLRERGLPVTLELSVESRFAEETPRAVNVVAEIRGHDPRLRDEVVMLGAHLDSWHSGTGALDDAAGCAVMIEAMRLLRAVAAKPRRTVRLALWTGEEQGLLGSVAYVEKHFGNLSTLAVTPEHSKLSAYFNIDWGGGRIRGIYLQGNERVRPIFAELIEPLRHLGVTTLSTLTAGGTDHMPFDALGLPGFQFIQDALRYETHVAHSGLDVLEAVSEPDLQQMAVVVASLVYHVAEREEPLPRKPLAKPNPDKPRPPS